MDEKEFLRKQIAEIELQKWLEGERIGRDPGEEFVRRWIKEHAEEFRAENNPSGTSQT
jgi:hypothetical protein